MEKVNLNSSAIKMVAYDGRSRRMHITFTSGGTAYTFCNVPRGIFEGLIAASSAGTFYDQHIRGRYQC